LKRWRPHQAGNRADLTWSPVAVVVVGSSRATALQAMRAVVADQAEQGLAALVEQERASLSLLATARAEAAAAAQLRQHNRTLFNQLQDLRGSIRVLCRVRPSHAAADEADAVVPTGGELGVDQVRDSPTAHHESPFALDGLREAVCHIHLVRGGTPRHQLEDGVRVRVQLP
jgi:hypothetical protein